MKCMFCENCGNKITDDAKFCACCGNKIIFESDGTDTIDRVDVQEKNKHEPVYDKFCWIMSCTTLISYALSFILSKIGLGYSWLVIVVCIIINCIMLTLDIKYLKKKGYQPNKWIWMGIILVPLYLGVRAGKTNKNFAPMIVCIVLM